VLFILKESFLFLLLAFAPLYRLLLNYFEIAIKTFCISKKVLCVKYIVHNIKFQEDLLVVFFFKPEPFEMVFIQFKTVTYFKLIVIMVYFRIGAYMSENKGR